MEPLEEQVLTRQPTASRLPRLPIRLRRNSAPFLAALLVRSAIVWAGPAQAVDVKNFGEVDENVYRGAVPSNSALQELRAQGVKLVIDLRENGRDSLRERQEVAALGMRYVNVPLSPRSAPTPDEVRTVLSLLGTQPVFVHCWRGKDRTGAVIACYRIQRYGWSNARALEEANHYGMSHMERAMRSFILHFSPAAIPVPSPYAAAPLPLTARP